MKRYLYIVGPDPYEYKHADNTRANGKWSAQAGSMKDALRTVFASMPYPCEATGRSLHKGFPTYVPGVSLEGRSAEEIIQVWSTEPACLKRQGPHDGQGNDLGLLTELDVTKLDEYLTPITALLAGPQGENSNQALSPLGASIVDFERQKHELQHEMMVTNFDIQQRQHALSMLEEGMEKKMATLQAKIDLMNTYVRGWSCHTQISHGRTGSGPYHLFQQRVFLAEEVALMGNFKRFDFKKMEAFDKWLLISGQIWKMLPLERCILVTRLRGEKLDYADPFDALFYNMMNMQNIVWVRDGENIHHIDVDHHFENAVFPDKEQDERIFNDVRQRIWKESFCPPEQEKHRFSYDRKLDPVPGTLMPVETVEKKTYRPEDEREPYTEVRLVNNRHTTYEGWLHSADYPQLLDAQLRGALQDYLRSKNKKQMTFCVLLQGIIDNTNLLQIPKGTDVFNWENISKYFVLLYDYTHGLPDRTFENELAGYFGPQSCKVGDWVIAYMNDRPHDSSDFGGPCLLQVHAIREDGWPLVRYRERPKRYRYRPPGEEGDGRVKQSIVLSLKPEMVKNAKYSSTFHTVYYPVCRQFFRVPLPPDLVTKILDNREWKKAHSDLVPLFAQYRYVLKTYLVNPKHMTEVELRETR